VCKEFDGMARGSSLRNDDKGEKEIKRPRRTSRRVADSDDEESESDEVDDCFKEGTRVDGYFGSMI
jgi:hypothetical protein